METTDPREFEKRKYNSIWQVLKSGNDIYSKYRTIESLVDGIIREVKPPVQE